MVQITRVMTTLVESSKEPESFVLEFLTPKCPFGSFLLKLFAYLFTFCICEFYRLLGLSYEGLLSLRWLCLFWDGCASWTFLCCSYFPGLVDSDTVLGTWQKTASDSADLSLVCRSVRNYFLSLILGPSGITRVTVKTRSDLPVCIVSKHWIFINTKSMD